MVDSSGGKPSGVGNDKAVITSAAGYLAARTPAANIPDVTGTAGATYDSTDRTMIHDLRRR